MIPIDWNTKILHMNMRRAMGQVVPFYRTRRAWYRFRRDACMH